MTDEEIICPHCGRPIGMWAAVGAFFAELAWIVGLTALVVLVFWLFLSVLFAPRPARADTTTAPLKSLCRRYVTAQLGLAHRACETDPDEAACVSGLRVLGKAARRDCRRPPPAVPVPPVAGLSLDAAMARLRLRGLGASMTLLEESAPKAMVRLQVPGPGGMVRPGGVAQLGVSLPPQGDFLTFFGGVQTTTADAEAYYALVDPDGERTTLADWRRVNGWGAAYGRETIAVYSNEFDLGFGRRMHLREDGIGLSYYVENFPDADAALAQDGLLATVAMEYRHVERLTTFYAFGPDGGRITEIDLDGRGAKAIPELCSVCHSGRWTPGQADQGGHFIPFVPESFGYALGAPRETQMDAFRALNAAILRTRPPVGVSALIYGWYSNPNDPAATYDRSYVAPGWNATPADRRLYRDVYVSACRNCHVLREPRIDFDTAQEFVFLGPQIRGLLASGEMPRARRTWEQLWLRTAPHPPNLLLQALP